ncbi:DgyrCDS14853 [Dimorphilus gyrociliatus]|uniref:DgyrCDS14853 n=1 Tax=Dimorphilus gyrociliatus TaxID=2664684 RepID=A0A7I8WFE7_9ANNE|nr:DgyrCDS14853 [Dimorphilus gyrociliatus]
MEEVVKQHPHWINYRDWTASCQSTACESEYLKITFASTFDIAEICIEQRIQIASELIKQVKLEFSNGASYVVQLDNINFEKCFLLPNSTGENTEWIKATALKGYGTYNYGLGSVLAYTFQEGIYHFVNDSPLGVWEKTSLGKTSLGKNVPRWEKTSQGWEKQVVGKDI